MLVIILVAALLMSGHKPDEAGWMMLLGLAWLAGYFDCRKFSASDRDQDRVLPPDANEPSNDSVTFES